MKQEGISIDGIVSEELGCARFKILLESGAEVIARISGKMAQHNIRVYKDDKVIVEVSPYDLSNGRITYRYR